MASILSLAWGCLFCLSHAGRVHRNQRMLDATGIHQVSNGQRLASTMVDTPDSSNAGIPQPQGVGKVDVFKALSSFFIASSPAAIRTRLKTPTVQAQSGKPSVPSMVSSGSGYEPIHRAKPVRVSSPSMVIFPEKVKSPSLSVDNYDGDGGAGDDGSGGGGGGGDGSGGENEDEAKGIFIPGSEDGKPEEHEDEEEEQGDDYANEDESDKDGVKKVLIIMSDTGGGHKASANAIAEALKKKYGTKVECNIVDIWTDYGRWPFNRFVPGYQWLAKHPFCWKLMYEYAQFPPTSYFSKRWGSMACYDGIEECLRKEAPDMIVSVHPLCQHLPLRVANNMCGGAKHRREKMPYVTVVTDLTECHKMWFHKNVDELIVPSDVVEKLAKRRGVPMSKVHQFGLPIRPGFKARVGREKAKLRSELGLDRNVRTALVVGGGDGIGKIEQITKQLASELSTDGGGRGQLVVVCGKNDEIKSRLEAVNWPKNVRVIVKGFVSNMDQYMGAADCIITKAGPGTIAESCASGLPIMLSAFLPGQEAGNIPFVVNRGIGAYSKRPKKIATTVSHWLQNPEELAEMSAKAKENGRPQAVEGIADRLGKLLFKEDEEAIASEASNTSVLPAPRKNRWTLRKFKA